MFTPTMFSRRRLRRTRLQSKREVILKVGDHRGGLFLALLPLAQLHVSHALLQLRDRHAELLRCPPLARVGVVDAQVQAREIHLRGLDRGRVDVQVLVHLLQQPCEVLLPDGHALGLVRDELPADELEEGQGAEEEDKVNPLGQVAKVARGVVEGAESEDDEGGVREHRQPGEARDHVVPGANVLGVDRQWPPDELEELESVDSNLRGDQDPPQRRREGEDQREEGEVAQKNHDLQVVLEGPVHLQRRPVQRLLDRLLADVRHARDALDLVDGDDGRRRAVAVVPLHHDEGLQELHEVLPELHQEHRVHLDGELRQTHLAVHLLGRHEPGRLAPLHHHAALARRLVEGDVEVEMEAVEELVHDDLADEAVDVVGVRAEVLEVVKLLAEHEAQPLAHRHLHVLDEGGALLGVLREGPALPHPASADPAGDHGAGELHAHQKSKDRERQNLPLQAPLPVVVDLVVVVAHGVPAHDALVVRPGPLSLVDAPLAPEERQGHLPPLPPLQHEGAPDCDGARVEDVEADADPRRLLHAGVVPVYPLEQGGDDA
mmetsp:Transcript_51394/g.112132  ORF Transcript_51394/g.112132 Transcript_51394/m.112132 type:complete len:547 (-) Transcript_51394:966-2606(-)